MANALPSTFLTIPRELRDEIYYAVIAEDEKIPFRVMATKDSFGSAPVKPMSGFIYTCRQINDEYLEILEEYVWAWSPSTPEEDAQWFDIEIWDMKFDIAMEFLNRLPDENRKKQCQSGEFLFTLRFSTNSSATRNDVIQWLHFCQEKSIVAYYKVPHLDWCDLDSRLYGRRVQYVHIYDLFEEESDGLGDSSEESMLFWHLRNWYCLRGLSNAAKMSRRGSRFLEFEVRYAEKQGWRKAKTAVERGMPVRAAFLPRPK